MASGMSDQELKNNITAARDQVTKELILFFKETIGEDVNAVEAYLIVAAAGLILILLLCCFGICVVKICRRKK